MRFALHKLASTSVSGDALPTSSPSSTPGPPGGSGPSGFYRQHHAVEAPQVDAAHFRQAWRVRTRIDKLAMTGAIDARTYQAALAYRRAHAIAFAGLVGTIRLDETGRAPSWRGARLERSERQLDAISQLRRMTNALGKIAVGLVEDVVVEDRSWPAIGKRLRVDRRTAQSWAIAALQRLAQVW